MNRAFLLVLVGMDVVLLLLCCSPVAYTQDNTEPVELDEIRVTPGKFTIREGTQSTVSLAKKEIDLFPLIDNDVSRAVQGFPGVVSNDTRATFNVRGGERDEVLVRLDGMELFEPYHLQDYGDAVSVIDLGLVSRVDLLMGGFPAEYGDKMSGVFDITTKEGSRDGFGVNLGFDLVNAHALLEGPVSDKGSWLFSARRGYADIILALMDADDELNPQYADLYGKLVYNLTAKDKLTLNGLYAWDKNFINEADDENDINSLYQNTMVWTKWRHTFSEKVWSDVFLFNGIGLRDRRKGRGFDDREFRFLGAKGEVTVQRLKRHTLIGGVEWRWSTAKYDYDVRERRSGVNQYGRITAQIDDDGGEFKAYLRDEWQIHPRVAINVGGRYLMQNYRRIGTQSYELGPRIAVAVKPIQDLILRAAWGLYHQPIDLMAIPVEDEVDSIGRAEEATHYVVGGEYTSGGNLFIRAEAYYKKLDNLSGQIRDHGRQTPVFTNPDSGHAKGFDLLISRAISDRLAGSLGYAFVVAKAQLGDQEFFREFDQRHTLGLNGSYRLSTGWRMHASWRFHTGNPTTSLTHTPVPLPDGRLTCDRQFGPTNAERLPAYHSLDLRFTKSSEYKSWNLTWYIQVLNLYNRSNIHERIFSEIRDEDTNAIIDCEVGTEPLFPIVPTLGVNATF